MVIKRQDTEVVVATCPVHPSYSSLSILEVDHNCLLRLIFCTIQELAVMGGLPLSTASSAVELPGQQRSQELLTKANEPASKPKKKICCACPDTKRLRDECMVEHGEAACTKWIEAHKQCLRAEGFNV
ncbi:hypothetical protein Droror1_Dr00005823 [Drosera rotundifolia]